MKANSKTLTKPLTSVVLFLILLNSNCKKDNDAVAEPSLVGQWSNVTQISTFSNIVTYYEFKKDGTGNEAILRITTASSTEISDENFKWTVSKNLLKIQFDEGEAEEYTFTFDDTKTELLLKSQAGDTKQYFKD